LDASLTAEFANGSVYGRHQCQPIVVEPDHCASVYGFGERKTQDNASVEAHLWWNGGWQFHWHHVLAYQPAVLRLGTYSLPLPQDRCTELVVKDDFAHASNGERGVAIQPLLGFEHVKANESDPQKRMHFLARKSLTLTAETKRASGEQDLMALVWTGLNAEERKPWKVVSSFKGKLKLCHPVLGEWQITDAELPKLSVVTA
jgi:hypothetical protein